MSSGGAGVIPGGVQCKFCRCDFPPEFIKEKACARCLKNKQKYGNPRPCEHCKVMAAFIGLKCQKCSNSIKKYGPPIPCYVCKLKCAFKRPGHDKTRAMCLMCMFKRQRAKADKDAAAGNNAGDGNHDTSMDTTDANNSSVSTPNGAAIHNGTPGSNGRNYKVQPKGYFLQTNMVQEIDYNDEGKTDLIGGWAKYKRKSLDVLMPDFDAANPPSAANLASNIGRGTPKRVSKHGMSAGEQMIMVLNLQAKISKLNATLSQKETQLMEKDEYWDRKLVEEKELLVVSEKELVDSQTNKEKEMREQVKILMERLDVSKTEIKELKEKAKKAAPPPPTKKNDSDAEDGQDKDPDDIKRYGDEDNRDSGKEDGDNEKNDSDGKSDDESDKENTKVRKKKGTQIDSDDEDHNEDSEMPEDGEENENKKTRKKGAVVFSDSEDEEDKKETGNDDSIEDSNMKEEEKDQSSNNTDKTAKRKGGMIFSDSEDDNDPKKVKSDNEGSSDKEEASAKDKGRSDSEDNEDENKIQSDNDLSPEKEVLSDKSDSNKNNSDSVKESTCSDTQESAIEESIENNGNHSDKVDSNKGNSDKEDSEKDNSDKEDSEKEDSDKENSAKGNLDKEDSDKDGSDKEGSDDDSDGDLVPKGNSEKKKGAAIFSDSDSDGNSDSD